MGSLSRIEALIFASCALAIFASEALDPQQLASGPAEHPQGFISNGVASGPQEAGHGPLSTTVCVEIRNHPSNPYTVCGPQISAPGVYQQQYPPQIFQPQSQFPFKELNIGNPPAQAQPSEQKPVMVNQRGMLIQQPHSMYLQPTYRQMPVMNIQSIPKKYSNPNYPTPNAMSTDGTLSMNCRVGGIKYPNHPESHPNYPSYRFLQPQVALIPTSYYPGRTNADPMQMAIPDVNQMAWSNFQDQQTIPMGKSNEAPMSAGLMTFMQPPHGDMNLQQLKNPDMASKDSKQKLMELKKQIAELQDITSNAQMQRESQPADQKPDNHQEMSEPKPNKNQPTKGSMGVPKPNRV